MKYDDLTIIFLTVNKVPAGWSDYHLKILKEAIKGYPVISISKVPMDFGTNILQTEPESSENIYRQMLKGAKLATTPYIAIAEDDVLYHYEHFIKFRPPLDTFAYNMTRWSLYTFGEATYSFRHRIGNFSLIAPRQLTIDALEERFAKYPDGMPAKYVGELGKPRTDKMAKLTNRKMVEFWTTIPIVQFSHIYGTELIQQTGRKRMAMIRAYSIPYWGSSKELVKKFV